MNGLLRESTAQWQKLKVKFNERNCHRESEQLALWIAQQIAGGVLLLSL